MNQTNQLKEWEKELHKWMGRFIDNGEDMDAYWQNSLEEFISERFIPKSLLKEKVEGLKKKEEDCLCVFGEGCGCEVDDFNSALQALLVEIGLNDKEK